MNKSSKPFPLKKAVAYGLGTVVAFSLLSLFFLFLQVRHENDRIVGEVIQISGDTFTIVNARGVTTTLLIGDDVRLRGVQSVLDISVGQRVMFGGKFVDDGAFRVDGLRVVGR